MKKFTGKNLIAKFVMLVVAFSAVAVFAGQKETIGRALNILKPEVRVQISGTVNRSNQTVVLEKAESVKAGEILDWKISSVNSGNASAQNYRVVGQIPAGTEFIAGSANGDAAPRVSYSIDGGQTFSAQPMIEERQNDGSVKQLPAPVSMYTQIKFEWANELNAQSQINAAYRVRVK